MSHYNLYESLGLDRAQSCSVLASEVDAKLAEPEHANTGGVAELEVARAILGDEEKRALYDARLDDPNAAEITIGSLRALANRPDQAPQATGVHPMAPPTGPQQAGSGAFPPNPYGGGQTQFSGGYPPNPYGGGQQAAATGVFQQAAASGMFQQAPSAQLPSALATFAQLPLTKKLVRSCGIAAIVAAFVAVLSVCFRWVTVIIGRDRFIVGAFAPSWEGSADHLDIDNGGYLWLLIGIPMLLVAVALIASGLLLFRDRFENVGGMLLVGSAIAISSVRLVPGIVTSIIGSRFFRQFAAFIESDPIRVEKGAGMILGLVAAIIVWLAAFMFVAFKVVPMFSRGGKVLR